MNDNSEALEKKSGLELKICPLYGVPAEGSFDALNSLNGGENFKLWECEKQRSEAVWAIIWAFIAFEKSKQM